MIWCGIAGRRHRDDDAVDQLVMALVVRAAVEEFLDAQQLVGEFHGHRIILAAPLFQFGVGLRQDLGEQRAVDIAAGLDDRDPLAGEPAALLERGRERRGAGALGEIVRIGEHGCASPAASRPPTP